MGPTVVHDHDAAINAFRVQLPQLGPLLWIREVHPAVVRRLLQGALGQQGAVLPSARSADDEVGVCHDGVDLIGPPEVGSLHLEAVPRLCQ